MYIPRDSYSYSRVNNVVSQLEKSEEKRRTSGKEDEMNVIKTGGKGGRDGKMKEQSLGFTSCYYVRSTR